jgi:twitching motility protein PilT
MFSLSKILGYAVKHGASDIHITVGNPPAVRIDGVIRFVGDELLGPEDTMRFAEEILPEAKMTKFVETGDMDTAYSVAGLGRFRVNLLMQRSSCGIVMRHVKATVMNFDDLHLPPAMEKISNLPRGLCLITGTTGAHRDVGGPHRVPPHQQEEHYHPTGSGHRYAEFQRGAPCGDA